MLHLPTESQKWPLQYVLLTYVNRSNGLPGSVNGGFGNAHAQTAPRSLQMAVVVLTLVPLLVVYPFMQKHFRTGMLTRAVKGGRPRRGEWVVSAGSAAGPPGQRRKASSAFVRASGASSARK
ncbi:hypothetical protein ABZ490_40945 [Streptomyces sp. NPDC005811]|uniref:hypothetical protein n=1 Tax=Streptomyces sp. NPDC005811 TaxID=3154565 RepID=UPI0033F4E6DE